MNLGLSADEVLTTTRSVRKRLDLERPVEKEVVMECLDIALQAPTGSRSPTADVIAATLNSKKNNVPITEPPGICANATGRV